MLVRCVAGLTRTNARVALGRYAHTRAVADDLTQPAVYADHIASLSTKELQEFLDVARVPRGDCFEKQDLINRALQQQVKLGLWHRRNQFAAFAYTLRGGKGAAAGPSAGANTAGDNLYLAITNDTNGASLPSLRGPGFRSPFAGLSDGFEPDTADLINAIDAHYRYEVEVVGMGENDAGITFAGTGDPLLRPDFLFESISDISVQRHGMPIRVVTTGLHDAGLAAQLPSQGVKKISVVLPAADPVTYNELMQPREGLNFNTVCSFIAIAAEEGCTVECTAVERPDVDVKAVRELALSLGAVEFRTRSFHP